MIIAPPSIDLGSKESKYTLVKAQTMNPPSEPRPWLTPAPSKTSDEGRLRSWLRRLIPNVRATTPALLTADEGVDAATNGHTETEYDSIESNSKEGDTDELPQDMTQKDSAQAVKPKFFANSQYKKFSTRDSKPKEKTRKIFLVEETSARTFRSERKDIEESAEEINSTEFVNVGDTAPQAMQQTSLEEQRCAPHSCTDSVDTSATVFAKLRQLLYGKGTAQLDVSESLDERIKIMQRSKSVRVTSTATAEPASTLMSHRSDVGDIMSRRRSQNEDSDDDRQRLTFESVFLESDFLQPSSESCADNPYIEQRDPVKSITLRGGVCVRNEGVWTSIDQTSRPTSKLDSEPVQTLQTTTSPGTMNDFFNQRSYVHVGEPALDEENVDRRHSSSECLNLEAHPDASDDESVGDDTPAYLEGAFKGTIRPARTVTSQRFGDESRSWPLGWFRTCVTTTSVIDDQEEVHEYANVLPQSF